MGGLEQELSERAIIFIKEMLAITESSLKAEPDRSAILGQRVRLLESSPPPCLPATPLFHPAI